MKESDFYKRAFEDSAFRREQLHEERYHRKVSIGFLACFAIVFIGSSLQGWLSEGSLWSTTSAICLVSMLSSTGRLAWASLRIAALKAFEEQTPNQSLQPTDLLVRG